MRGDSFSRNYTNRLTCPGCASFQTRHTYIAMILESARELLRLLAQGKDK